MRRIGNFIIFRRPGIFPNAQQILMKSIVHIQHGTFTGIIFGNGVGVFPQSKGDRFGPILLGNGPAKHYKHALLFGIHRNRIRQILILHSLEEKNV